MKVIRKRTAQRATARRRRHRSVRRRLQGTPGRPRLVVYRSLKHIYAQVVDDERGHTLAAASSNEKTIGAGEDRGAISKQVGELVAERAIEVGVKAICFDRNGYLYHGRVRALADAAREKGLEF
ncbi:MAG: 50S ribosomal protein L18 [Gemmatimonadetes bacterium]|nr:50S ribosomal protein L18 [Gemmatimonadota bacterium]